MGNAMAVYFVLFTSAQSLKLKTTEPSCLPLTSFSHSKDEETSPVSAAILANLLTFHLVVSYSSRLSYNHFINIKNMDLLLPDT